MRAVEHDRLAILPRRECRRAHDDRILPVAAAVRVAAVEIVARGAPDAAVPPLLAMPHGRDMVAIHRAHRGEAALGVVRIAEPLNVAVDRVAFDPRRAVHHVDHRLDDIPVLRGGRVVGVVRPVRAVVELRDPDGPLRDIVDVLQKIVEVVGRGGRVVTRLAAVVVDRHDIHAHARGVCLIDEVGDPTGAAVRHRRCARAQSGAREFVVARDRIGHRTLRRQILPGVLDRIVRLVEAEEMIHPARLPVLAGARPIRLLLDGHILPVQRRVSINVPVIVPVRVQVRGRDIARAFLAHPAPREDPHMADRVIQRRGQAADFKIAILRHVAPAVVHPIIRCGEGRHVAALEFERTDASRRRAERGGVVGCVLAEPPGTAAVVAVIENLQRLKRRRVRHDHRAHAELHEAHIPIQHRRRAIHPQAAQKSIPHLRRHDAGEDHPRIRRIEMHRAAGQGIGGVREAEFRAARHRHRGVRERGVRLDVITEVQRLPPHWANQDEQHQRKAADVEAEGGHNRQPD